MIKEHLALSLKALQKRYVASDELVTSEDRDANLLCCALEAVFIHRIKSKFVRCESGGRGRKDHRPLPQPSFWNILKTVTHGACAKSTTCVPRDVITELEKLSFVGTEVGRSRAWLRLALNHGLLECYLTSLFREGSELQAYYQPSALLLHPEDREVLLSYVQGLASLSFSLSYKSAVLNQWTATPLALAGLCPASQADALLLYQQPVPVTPRSKESWDVASQCSASSEGWVSQKGIHEGPVGEQGPPGEQIGPGDKGPPGGQMGPGDQGAPGQEQPILHSSTISLETCGYSSQLSSSISSDSLLQGQELDLDLGGGPDSQDSTREDSFMSNADPDHRSGTSTSGGSSGSDSETMSPGPSFQNHQTQPTQEIQNHSTQNLPIQLALSQNHQDKPSQRQKSQDKATHNQTPPTPDHPTQEDQNQDFATPAGAEPFPVPRVAAVPSIVSVSVVSDLAGSTEGSEAMQKEQNTEASGKEKKNSEPLVNGGLLPRSASILSRKQSSDSLLHSCSWISEDDIYKPRLGEESDMEEDHSPGPPTPEAPPTTEAEGPASVVHRRQIGLSNPFRGLLKLGHLARRGPMGMWRDHYCELSPFEFRLYLDGEERTCADNCSLLRCEEARHCSSTDGRFQLSFHGKRLLLRAADRGEAEDWVDRIVEAAKKCRPASRHDNQWEELQFPDDRDKDEMASSGSSPSPASPQQCSSLSGRETMTAEGPDTTSPPAPPTLTEELDWRRGGDPEPDAIKEAVLYFSSSRSPGARGGAWEPLVFSLSLERLQGFRVQEEGRKGVAQVNVPVEAIRDVVPDVSLGGPEFFKLLTSGRETLRLRAQTPQEAQSWRALIRGALDSYLESGEEGGEAGVGGNVRRLVQHALKEDGVMLEQMFSVPTHTGLDAQGFTCAGCPRQIGLSLAKARLCDFSGRYYCESCHHGDLSIIPSRMVHNWDLTPRQVSQRALRLLAQVEHEPLLNLEQLNPELLGHAQPIAQVHQLRLALRLLGEYLSTCRSGARKTILARVDARGYLLESSQLYSVMDLRQIAAGQYVAYLSSLVQVCSEHVHQCDLCSQRGFICQICHAEDIIFPFQLDSTSRCGECKAVFHAACKMGSSSCPRCHRFRKYLERDLQD
ncbi:hypothetical protein CRUP_013885 [Coryphaenoides rupestris]|nr:hypothetical protein CRUP_013885 [Coryphaenoides rupestris]